MNKNKIVTIRIAEKDKELIKTKANKVGISLSKFLILSALNSEIKVVQSTNKENGS